MTLQDVLTIVWRRRWIVLFLTLIGGTAAWFAGGTTTANSVTYRGEVTLTVAPGEEPRSVDLYAFIANETSEIDTLVWTTYGEIYGEDLPGEVDVTSVSTIGALRVVASGQPSEEIARTVVDLYATEISDYGANQRISDRNARLERLATLEAELQDTVQRLDRELAALEASLPEAQQNGRVRRDQLKETELTAASDALASVLRERAELTSQTDDDLRPFEPVGVITVRPEAIAADPLGRNGRMAVGITLGFILGLLLAFGLHRFDARLFTRRDAEAAYSLPVMAEIPKIPWRKRRKNRIITKESPTDKASEAYRVLRSAIARARAVQLAEPTKTNSGKQVSKSGAVILVTSASAAVGKTTTVANLAVAATDAGSTVLVASADLREPTIHEYFDVDPAAPGLTDAARVIRQGYQARLDSYVVRTNVVGVSFLPHGSTVVNPGEILADAQPLLEEARSQFDLVILDSPPMLAGNDVDELVPTIDLVVQVARAGRTTIDEGLWTDETIQRRQMPTCGLVLIGARSDLERRSSSRRSGIWSKFANLFGRGIGQTGKIAWGDKSMPPVPSRPPVQGGGSQHPIADGQTTMWPEEYPPPAPRDEQGQPDFAITQQIVLPLPPPGTTGTDGGGGSNGNGSGSGNGSNGNGSHGSGDQKDATESENTDDTDVLVATDDADSSEDNTDDGAEDEPTEDSVEDESVDSGSSRPATGS